MVVSSVCEDIQKKLLGESNMPKVEAKVERYNIDPALVARGDDNPINRDACDVYVYYNTETNKYIKSISFESSGKSNITWTDDINEADVIIIPNSKFEMAKEKGWKNFFGGLKIELRRRSDY